MTNALQLNYNWLQFIASSFEVRIENSNEQDKRLEVLKNLQTLTKSQNINVLRLFGYVLEESGESDKAVQHWQNVPDMANELVRKGDEFWLQREYDYANKFYSLALKVSKAEMPKYIYFRCVVSSILSKREQPSNFCNDRQIGLVLQDKMTLISGNSLQWLDALPYWNIRSGDRLPTFQPNGASGIMWWKGTSLTIVKTQASGNYLLRLFVENAQHNSDFIVLVNDEEISHISIKGFGVSEYTVDAVLNSGLNIIAINFPNDIGDLIIHEIQVIRI